MPVTDSKRNLIPLLFAAGAGIASGPASALELGDLQVQSTLGQPLRASVRYALAPNEELASYCVTLRNGRSVEGIPSVGDARIAVANGVINLTGSAPVREPLVAVSLSINCPYSPQLTRDYTLFVDPAVPAPAVADVAEPRPTLAAPVQRATPPTASQPQPVRAAAADTIGASRYRVQPGDTLSGIAERIENRGVGLWAAVTQIHAANPDAFQDNDPNRLKAGVWLSIPDFGPGAAFVAAAETAPATVAPAAATMPASLAESAPVPAPVTESEAQLELSAAQLDELRPGDVVTASSAADSSADGVVTIPVETASSPNVPVATIVRSPERASPTGGSLWWLAGGGILLLGGILWFGRRGRGAPLTAPAEPDAVHPLRRMTDTQKVDALVAHDYELDDDSPTSENLALDANLAIGSGLDARSDMTVIEDFGYSAGSALDLELPDETGSADSIPETDIIPAPRIEASSILESEVLPDDDDYDMSVIMDATKVPDPVEVTKRDLKAVAIDSDDETEAHDSYTISREIDYQVLEQDYEEELSATQALNLEIERAAAELARQKNDDIEVTDVHEQPPRPPRATVTRLDVVGRNAAPANDDDTDMIEASAFADDDDEKTISEEMTARLPASDDETAEMPIKPGKVDKKLG